MCILQLFVDHDIYISYHDILHMHAMPCTMYDTRYKSYIVHALCYTMNRYWMQRGLRSGKEPSLLRKPFAMSPNQRFKTLQTLSNPGPGRRSLSEQRAAFRAKPQAGDAQDDADGAALIEEQDRRGTSCVAEVLSFLSSLPFSPQKVKDGLGLERLYLRVW